MSSRAPVRVYAFGTFDGIHQGHRSYLRQAKQLGDHLTVIVARDQNVVRAKGQPPVLTEDKRRQLVKALGLANEVKLGQPGPPLEIFRRERVDVVCLGYDQPATASAVRNAAKRFGQSVRVVRARPFLPLMFRSRLLKRLGLVKQR